MASVAILRRGRAGLSPLGDDSTRFKLGKSLWFSSCVQRGKRTHNVRFPKYGMCYASGSFSNMSYPGRRQQAGVRAGNGNFSE